MSKRPVSLSPSCRNRPVRSPPPRFGFSYVQLPIHNPDTLSTVTPGVVVAQAAATIMTAPSHRPRRVRTMSVRAILAPSRPDLLLAQRELRRIEAVDPARHLVPVHGQGARGRLRELHLVARHDADDVRRPVDDGPGDVE